MEHRTVRQCEAAAVTRRARERSSAGLIGAVAWAAGVLGGMATLIAWSFSPAIGVSAYGPGFARARRSPSRIGTQSPAGSTFRAVRAGMLGKPRQTIARTLGPPQAASAGDIWHAATWYYPFIREERFAIAIEFADGRAVNVEYIAGV